MEYIILPVILFCIGLIIFWNKDPPQAKGCHHEWNNWEEHLDVTQRRQCKKCGLTQQKNI